MKFKKMASRNFWACFFHTHIFQMETAAFNGCYCANRGAVSVWNC